MLRRCRAARYPKLPMPPEAVKVQDRCRNLGRPPVPLSLDGSGGWRTATKAETSTVCSVIRKAACLAPQTFVQTGISVQMQESSQRGSAFWRPGLSIPRSRFWLQSLGASSACHRLVAGGYCLHGWLVFYTVVKAPHWLQNPVKEEQKHLKEGCVNQFPVQNCWA